MEQTSLPGKVDGKKSFFLDLLRGILLGFVIVVFILFILNYLNILQFTQIAPIFSLLPHQAPSQLSVPATNLVDNPMLCSVAQKRYLQLTGTHFNAEGITGGTLHGLLKKVSYNPGSQTATLEVSALSNNESFVFTLNDQTVRAANTQTNSYYTSLSQVTAGSHVELVYNCNPSQGNIFVIVEVNIVP